MPFPYSVFIEFIDYVKVEAMTGRDPVGRRGGSQRSRYGSNPQLIILLKNGKSHRASLLYNKYEGTQYTTK